MNAVSGKRLAQLVQDKGWQLVRTKGSHHIFVKDGRLERAVIPIHGNKSLKIGLQKALMKIIPVTEDEL